MKNKYYFFAFDLGATSGRSILATVENKTIEFRELTRFTNKIINIHNKYYWDIFSLYEELKNGLKAVSGLNIELDAIGIDTWGVDFVYLGEDDTLLSQPRSYRDPYTNGMPEEYFKILSKKEVYDRTGIQIMNFNSLFQLFAAKKENFAALNAAKSILFMPDALSYMLTGKKVCEYTIASTSQLINPKTKAVEKKLFDVIGLNADLMQPIVMAGDICGYLTDAVAQECGQGKVPVVAVAGHDTASAVVAVPAENKNFAYLSSGTWSLMGIEVEEPIINDASFAINFTNEGGAEGTTRFLKNITGMWLFEQCLKEWEAKGRKYYYADIIVQAASLPAFKWIIDPDDSSFANPGSMVGAIQEYCKKTNQESPQTDAEFTRCIFDSLALKYKYVFDCLQKMAPFRIEKLHVIGGGSQNKILNQFTANALNIPVVAGPYEATALGNVLMQAKGVGLVSNLQEIRDIVRRSVSTETFLPQDTQSWSDAYNYFYKKSHKQIIS